MAGKAGDCWARGLARGQQHWPLMEGDVGPAESPEDASTQEDPHTSVTTSSPISLPEPSPFSARTGLFSPLITLSEETISSLARSPHIPSNIFLILFSY